jgi:putative transposase
MSSYRQILYHLIFHTKWNCKTLIQGDSHELYAYIMGIIQNKHCHLYRINGVENHIHILSDLHPSIALADYMKDIKVASSIWIKQSGKFPKFSGWAVGYSAFTHNWKDKEKIICYIRNQQIHHQTELFENELRRLMKENGVEVNEKYFLTNKQDSAPSGLVI